MNELNLGYNRFKTYNKDFLYMNKLRRLNLTGNYGYKLANFFKFLPLSELEIEWPCYVDSTDLTMDDDSKSNSWKIDLPILNSLMEKHDFVTFETYRRAVEGTEWRQWDDRVAYNKALMGIRK